MLETIYIILQSMKHRHPEHDLDTETVTSIIILKKIN